MKAVREYDWRAAVGDAFADVVTLRATGPTTPASGPRRLLSDTEAAAYLKSSRSYVRALVHNGVIKRVELPATDGSGERARMLRIDVRDLDALIDKRNT